MMRILPMILMLLGISELILAFLNIQMPIVMAVALGILLIALGVKMLVDIAEKK